MQTTADAMDARMFKQQFGNKLVFHGAIDTQGVLPASTPDQVYRYAVNTLQVLGREGGYVFAPCNNLQGDTPVENLDALFRAAREYRIN